MVRPPSEGGQADQEPSSQTWPRLYLAVDNCFASKRWTRPSEWIPLVSELGVSHVEASADTECDPLYTSPEYLDDWVEEVQEHGDRHGVKIANLYSGHGTYATLGLAHTDIRIRDRIQHAWLEPMIRNAARIGAGLGFFCHAFPQRVLQSPTAYADAVNDLYSRLAELSAYAASHGVKSVGVEQMYSPNQIPWTLAGARDLLGRVNAEAGAPLYVTIDVGHQCAQRKFLRPSAGQVRDALRAARAGGEAAPLWLGPAALYGKLNEPARCPASSEEEEAHHMCAEMEKFPYLFAEQRDGDPYVWIEDLGCYAPIIHLQQTDGTVSAHWPFTEFRNRNGLIAGDRVLHAIAHSYRREAPEGMPPRCLGPRP